MLEDLKTEQPREGGLEGRPLHTPPPPGLIPEGIPGGQGEGEMKAQASSPWACSALTLGLNLSELWA